MRLASLRFRLLLLVVLAVLPGIGLLLYVTDRQSALVQEAEREDVAQLAQFLAREEERAIESAEGLLTGLAQIPQPVDAAGRERCDRVLAEVVAELPVFSHASLVDTSGDIVCAAHPPAGRVNLSRRRHFRLAMQAGGFAVGEYVIARTTGLPSLHFARAVRGADGAVVAAATAGLDLGRMQRQLEATKLPDGTVAVIADANGVVLAERPDRGGTGLPWRSRLLPALLAGGAPRDHVDDSGVERFHAFATAHQPDGRPALHVAVGVPIASLFGEARRVLFRSLLGYGALAALMVLLAVGMGEVLLVRRLNRVIAAARRLARGDLAARTGLGPSAGEIGELAAVFDEMAGSLEVLSRQNGLILDSAGEGIVGLDGDGKIVFANPAAARSLGREVAELHGRTLDALARPSPGPGEEGGGPGIEDALRGGALRQRTATFERQGGERFPVELVATPIRDGGRVVGAVVAFRDVSERQRLEEQLRHAQKMEAVGQLAGGVAHDFNNLLTAILSFARFVHADLGEGHPSRPDVEEILTSAELAAGLTRQLLAFSRRQVLEPRLLDLGETVRGVEKLLRRLIGEDVTLETRVVGAPGKVKADPGHVEQVILNLAVNARDAMPGGGHLLIEVAEVAPDDPEVLGDPALPPGPLVRLAISDDGAGIDEATLARIFEPFFTTKPAGKGTGLGLSTVYGIVAQSGGAIRVRSAPGQGSTFRVYLPRAREPTPAPAAAAAPANVAAGGETVLLVEDDAAVRALARRALAGAGYRVLEASCQEEALAQARGAASPVQLLLSDVILPGANGPELAAQLRGSRPTLRVLFMSGYTAGHLGTDELAPGDGFLAKPFTPEALLRRVREVLDAPAPARAAVV